MELVAIPCPICGTSYPSRISIKNHIKVRHPSRNLEVEMQHMIAKYPLLFPEDHKRSTSSTLFFRRGRKGRMYHCEVTEVTILSPDLPLPPLSEDEERELEEYEKLEEEDFEDVTILESSNDSSDYQELDVNLNESKRDNQKFICDKCDSTFNLRVNRDRHMESVHKISQGDRYKCDKCDRLFNYAANYAKHGCDLDLSILSPKKKGTNICPGCKKFRPKNQLYCDKCLKSSPGKL